MNKLMLVVLLVVFWPPILWLIKRSDDRPCLNGICVGDEISKLSGIKWVQATFNGRPISTMKMDDKAYIEKYVRFCTKAQPLLSLRHHDIYDLIFLIPKALINFQK